MNRWLERKAGERHQHEERWQHESQAGQRRATQTEVDVVQVDRQQRRQRTRHQLAQRQAFLVIILRNPAPALDQFVVDVADEGYRAAETPSAGPSV